MRVYWCQDGAGRKTTEFADRREACLEAIRTADPRKDPSSLDDDQARHLWSALKRQGWTLRYKEVP